MGTAPARTGQIVWLILNVMVGATLGCGGASAPPPPPQTPEPPPAPPAPTPPPVVDAQAEQASDIRGEEVTYDVDGKTFTGYLAFDAEKADKRPGVIVVHEWWGPTEYVRTRARMLAEMGYTALALDMYGDGKVATHPDDAKKFMGEVLANMPGAEKRFAAAYSLLVGHQTVDPARVAAIGYCFGGGVVLHMARTHTPPLLGVASFHGALNSGLKVKPGSVTAKILVLTGDADPMIPAEQVVAFEKEMTTAKADFKVIRYPGAKHSFTNPDATAAGEKYGLPVAYSAEADAQSWAELDRFFKELFADRAMASK